MVRPRWKGQEAAGRLAERPVKHNVPMPTNVTPAVQAGQETLPVTCWCLTPSQPVRSPQGEFVYRFVGGCLTSQQHASVSQGRICSDKFTCCQTEMEVADQTVNLTQSQV